MNKTILGISTVFLVIVTFVGLSFAFPFGGRNLERQVSPENKEEMLNLKLQIQNSIENRDYESWLEVMETRLSEEEFNKLVSIHEERKENLNKFGEFKGPWKNRERKHSQENKMEMRPDCKLWLDRLEK